MSSHVITVIAYDSGDGAELVVECSCGAKLGSEVAMQETLDALNELAHEHIESAERGEKYDEIKRRSQVRWPQWAHRSDRIFDGGGRVYYDPELDERPGAAGLG